MTTQTIWIDLGQRTYPIHVGAGLLETDRYFGDLLHHRRAAIVTDDTVAPLYLEHLRRALSDPAPIDIVLPTGEQHKTLSCFETVCTKLLQAGIGRNAVLIALGGGVVGDVTGFVAACYQRGIDFIQVPTTLLAQVDSSVGGKTGVNHALGKNMIGAFHQPCAVISDLKMLDSLPQRHVSAGLAEIIKYGLITDADLFVWLERNMQALMQRNGDALSHAIVRSCEIKAQLVAQDERESGGHRILLNLGHTFAHAIETALGYGRWLHGEAVGCGMLLAATLSHQLELVDGDTVARIRALLEQAGLPVKMPAALHPDELLNLITRDKKNLDGNYRLILLKRIGDAFVNAELTRREISNFLNGIQRG